MVTTLWQADPEEARVLRAQLRLAAIERRLDEIRAVVKELEHRADRAWDKAQGARTEFAKLYADFQQLRARWLRLKRQTTKSQTRSRTKSSNH